MNFVAGAKRAAISDASALAWLLLSPRGWIGRINFLRGAATIFIVNSLLVAVSLRFLIWKGASSSLSATAIAAPCLITLYPSVCVAGKRLHGLGYSAWLQAPVRLLTMTGLVLMAAYQRIDHSDLINTATFAAFFLGIIADVAMLLWLAVAPNRLDLETRTTAAQA